tara:strand:+ start:125 stop:331 length:207 start_codon:yes stop_codon:yes gene_type:complete
MVRLHAVEIAKDKMYAFSVWDTEGNIISLYTGNKSYIRQKIALVNKKMAKEKQVACGEHVEGDKDEHS